MWEDVDTDSIDERLIEEKVYSILDTLPERYRKVVMLRNGFGCTYSEIGERFKVSAERIRQVNAKALRILRSRYEREFKSLDIPWINRYFIELDKENKRYEEELEKHQREWHQKQVELKIIEAAKRREREKLKIVDSEIPKPEAIVNPYSQKPPYFPPFFVKLLYNDNNQPFLHVHKNYGTINRDLDPVTYDRWLAYLIDPKSTKVCD